MQNDDKISLEDAYALQTPEDNVALYRHWAETYDVKLARDRGYQYPQIIADIYARHSKPADTPVLDVGSGTGLVASALQEHHSVDAQLTIDGVDISPEMLAVSRTKNVYRHLFEADLTQSIDLPEKQYGAVVSAGTFTHGHVGPEALIKLLRLCRAGALFVIGVNGTAFDQYHFGSHFAALQADQHITPIEFIRVQYYATATDGHAADQGYAALFRKT
jgi:predicted TPR repeat methyltransferase